MKNITVNFNDIKKIGNTVYGTKNTHFICDGNTANIEEILLRNILSIKGYKIVMENDYKWDNGSTDIEFTTDMPWDEYKKYAN